MLAAFAEPLRGIFDVPQDGPVRTLVRCEKHIRCAAAAQLTSSSSRGALSVERRVRVCRRVLPLPSPRVRVRWGRGSEGAGRRWLGWGDGVRDAMPPCIASFARGTGRHGSARVGTGRHGSARSRHGVGTERVPRAEVAADPVPTPQGLLSPSSRGARRRWQGARAARGPHRNRSGGARAGSEPVAAARRMEGGGEECDGSELLEGLSARAASSDGER
jgi:hypothetical protein